MIFDDFQFHVERVIFFNPHDLRVFFATNANANIFLM
jgi:hypothetical protein